MQILCVNTYQKNNANTIRNSIIQNSIANITNEWKKINDHNIDQILISKSINATLLPSDILSKITTQTSSEDLKIILIEANSKTINKYNYVYVYKKRENSSQYELNSQVTSYLALNVELINKIVNFFNTNNNSKVKWKVLNVK